MKCSYEGCVRPVLFPRDGATACALHQAGEAVNVATGLGLAAGRQDAEAGRSVVSAMRAAADALETALSRGASALADGTRGGQDAGEEEG